MNVEVRAMKTPAEQSLADIFAAAKGNLPGKGALAALREDAFRRFEAQGLPTRRVEEWKYTDLRALMREAKPLAGAPGKDAKDAKTRAKNAMQWLAGIDCRKLVFIDGAFAADLSDLSAEEGLEIGSMRDALAKGDALVAAHVGKVFDTADPAVALNTALMGDGAVIRIAAGTALKRPLAIIFAGVQPASVFTRSLIVAGSGAKVFIIETHDNGETQSNTALDLVVGDGAEVDHLKMTCANGLHLSSLMALVGAKARFNSFLFTLGSSLVRNQMFVRFAGTGTQSTLGGATLLKGREHVDNTLLITHAAEGCTSRERFRSVLDGESRGVFQGKIVVEPSAQKTDAKMVSNALLLSDSAEADNKPELEIFADDVVCGHGATAGALDEGLKFYLMSRGIPEKEAEALLVEAFINEAIDAVSHAGARDALKVAALRWLGARK